MKVLLWNFHGLGNPLTRAILREFCVTPMPYWLCNAEPFIVFGVIANSFWPFLVLHVIALNDHGPLLLNV